MYKAKESTPEQEKIIVPFCNLPEVAQNIVREIHARLVQDKIFVPRKDEAKMWDNHHVIIDPSNGDLPLAGASTIDDASADWTELTRIWTQEHLRGNGVASAIVQHWITTVQNRLIFALTTKEGASNMLQKNGFEMVGPVHDLQSEYGASLPKRVQTYPEGRNPWMLARFSEK